MREHDLASVAVAAAWDGEIVWEEAFGWADRQGQRPATPDSIYALASISKSFTATGVMVLVERGLVDLDRPVNDYLGDAKLRSHGGDADRATVRHVLQHSAGLPMHYNIFFADESARPPDPDESIRRYGIVADDPGREFVYSNFGYGVLERVIARVSGTSYADFLRTEVLSPLGLTHTYVSEDPGLEAETVRHYDADGNLVPALDFDHRGASAVHASVHDLIRFGLFHLNSRLPGQVPILGETAIGEMQRPSPFAMPETGAGEVHLGLGWAVADVLGIRFILASGGMPGTLTRLALIPEENVAVAIAINSGTGGAYSPWDIEWETFTALVPGFPELPKLAEEERTKEPLPAALDGVWVGTIRTYPGDLAAELSIRDGRVRYLAINGRKAKPIRWPNPLGRVRFRAGVLEAPLSGSIRTPDSLRSRHVLFLRLRLRGDRLDGVVSAVARNRSFWLPHAMTLEKTSDP